MKRMRRSNGRRWALLKRSVAYLACFLERKTKTWFKWGQLQDARASRLVSSLRSSKLYSEYEPNHSNWIKRSHESAGMRGGVQKESVVHTIIKGSINLFSLGKSEIKDRGLILKEPKLKIFCRRKCKVNTTFGRNRPHGRNDYSSINDFFSSISHYVSIFQLFFYRKYYSI